MTSTTARPVPSTIRQGTRARTAAQRLLRSLNSLGIIVADSTPTDRDLDSADGTQPVRPRVDGSR